MKIDWKKEIKLPKPSRPKLPGRRSVDARASEAAKAPEVAKAPKIPKSSKSAKGAGLAKARRPKVPRVSRPKASFEAPAFLADVKPPKFVADLYADLRDRRLLPLVAVLVVAIAAVPFLLSDKSEPEPTVQPPIVASTAAQASDTGLTVVPAETGLLDYRKRLGHRDARDPFKQPGSGQSSATPAEGESAKSGSEGPTGASEDPKGASEGSSGASEGSNGVSESSNGDESAAPEGSSGTSGESIPNSPAGGGSEGSAEVNSGAGKTPVETSPVIVEREVTGFAIEAKTAFVGKPAKAMAGIKEMTKLPNPKRPIAIYLGPGKGKKGALFLLGSQVTAYYGHGRCTLDKQACSVLELRPGKSATLAYGLGDSRYKITLKKLEPEVQISKVSTAQLGVTPSHR